MIAPFIEAPGTRTIDCRALRPAGGSAASPAWSQAGKSPMRKAGAG